MSTPTSPDRNPLRRTALTVGGVVAGLGGLLGAAVQLGVLTNVQADTISLVGEQLPGGILAAGALVTLVTGMVSTLVGAFVTVKVGERVTTPSADPRDADGNRLTPEIIELP